MIHSHSQMHFSEIAAWFASIFRKKYGLSASRSGVGNASVAALDLHKARCGRSTGCHAFADPFKKT
jgi:hypothetical protein